MPRVLVLGASGMLGHKVFERLAGRFDTVGWVRKVTRPLRDLESITGARMMGGLDLDSTDGVDRILQATAPDVVVNCVGVIKQRNESSDRVHSITINSLLPHRLAQLLSASGTRLIHLSTDCVFSGDRGGYVEADRPDPVDVYGSSKLLGEPDGGNVLTLRTSMIGRELRGFHSLLEWFLRQPPGATVRGFTAVRFSGPTNLALADEIARLIEHHPQVSGLYHLSADPISKYDLLLLITAAFKLKRTVAPDDTVRCDRTLRSDRYRALTGFSPRSWPEMIVDLVDDPAPYARWQETAT